MNSVSGKKTTHALFTFWFVLISVWRRKFGRRNGFLSPHTLTSPEIETVFGRREQTRLETRATVCEKAAFFLLQQDLSFQDFDVKRKSTAIPRAGQADGGPLQFGRACEQEQ
jgi:hypothetical protein